jgi:uncharacterized protein YabN with tetrapyrrole methylase and pyrophosphatase domain
MKKHTPLELDIRELIEKQGYFVTDNLIQSILNKVFHHATKVFSQNELEKLLEVTQHSGNNIQRNRVRIKKYKGKRRKDKKINR